MERAVSGDPNYQRIKLTESEWGLFVQFPRPRFRLQSNRGESSWTDLSIEEARELFRSIESACRRQEVETVEIGDTKWTTDARPNARNPDGVIVKIGGQMGPARLGGLSRARLLSACKEFANVFGEVTEAR
jgi:hypothetical protein